MLRPLQITALTVSLVCQAVEQFQERRIDWLKRHEKAQGIKTYLTMKVDPESL